MIEILDKGYHITIQDSGRNGYSAYGVTRSGFMDSISANKANGLLSNSLNEAVFEITMMGGKFRFHSWDFNRKIIIRSTFSSYCTDW